MSSRGSVLLGTRSTTGKPPFEAALGSSTCFPVLGKTTFRSRDPSRSRRPLVPAIWRRGLSRGLAASLSAPLVSRPMPPTRTLKRTLLELELKHPTRNHADGDRDHRLRGLAHCPFTVYHR